VDERHRRIGLGSTFLANFSQFGARLVISPFVPAVAATFTATKGTVGLVLTLMWAVFAIAHYPSGVLADRYGESLVMRSALVVVTVGSLLVATAPTLLAFAAGCVVLGLGGGAYFPTGQTFLSRLYGHDGRGAALSIHGAGGPLAGVVLPVIATAVAARYSWRAGIAVGTVAMVLTVAILAVVLRDYSRATPAVDVVERLRPGNVTALLARPPVLTTVALGGVGMYCFQGFVSFYPTFLREYHGLTAGRASALFAGAFFLIVLGLPVIGRLADRVGAERSLFVPFGALGASVTLLLAVPTAWSALVGSALAGLGLAGGGAIAKRAMTHFHETDRGTGFGIVRMLFVLLGSLANVVTGTIAQYWGWVPAYGILVALSVAILGLLAVLVVVDPPSLAEDATDRDSPDTEAPG
jgi:MFS family permease